ncbi:MAG: bifunctional serine/threonine-protein kinase/formylglycine-generating enzyme family protein [Pseudomonadota bacterium]
MQISGYTLKKKLGVGGMATVYLAIQNSLQREVALKVMSPALAADRTFAHRFVGEARTIAELNHPNIVSIHDVGVTPERLHYFAMQFLPNGDLEERIPDGLRERELLRIVLPICSALGHAHERGFVHRDVTPGNIMFDTNDQPVLTDFGIARVVSETTRMTATGLSMGTSNYMSPEQARGRVVDHRSDIYSLGAVIFECIAGHPPYPGDDSFSVAYAHVYEPVPKLPPRFLRWQLLIDKCMAKEPEERFASMAEMAQMLKSFLHRTTGKGRKPELDLTTSAATLQLPIPDLGAGKSGRLRWAALALGRGPREWASGLRPAVRRAGAWWIGKLLRNRAVTGAVAVLLASAAAFGGWWLWRDDDPAPETVAQAAAPAPAQIAEAQPLVDPEPAPPTLPQVDSEPPSQPVLVDLDQSGSENPVDALLATPQGQARLLALLDDAAAALADNRLTTPVDDNAFDLYQSALSLDPENETALDGLRQIVRRYVALARSAIDRGRYDGAQTLARRAVQVARQTQLDRVTADALDSIETYGYQQTVARAEEAFRVDDRNRARQQYNAALKFRPDDAAVLAALAELDRPPEPVGPQLVRDALAGGGEGPEMLLLEDLAVGVREVSVGEFRRFVDATGRSEDGSCRNLESWLRASRKRTWRAPGFDQDDRHPVVCVNYAEAQAYVDWLTQETGRQYRLPSSAEWRRLAGDPGEACSENWADASLTQNLGRRQAQTCDDGYSFTAPGGQFAASRGAVYDLLGNVREWTGDCLRERSGKCRQVGVVGMSWMDGERADFSTTSRGFDPRMRYNTVGFRVVREVGAADG